MINRTITLALLAVMTSPIFAGAFSSPALDSANGLANGKSYDMTFDGNASKAAAVDPVTGAAITGMSASAPASASAAPTKQSAAAEPPTPPQTPVKKSFLKKIASKAGIALVLGGAGVGFVLGGPIGALIGALAGVAIGFLVSKVLHKKKH
ncbi:MAG: hypothetical protein ACHQ2Z_00010 [Elusimicrobiota bacterium]